MSSREKDVLLFNIHVFLRDFFYATAKLGWIYLFLSGVRIELLFFSFFMFRVLESFVFMPISLSLSKKIHYKVLFFIGIVLTIIYQYSFYLAQSNILFLLLTILSISILDVLYWPLRKNLQRETVAKDNVARGVGVSQAVQILGEASGVFLTAFLLSKYSNVAFIISSIGLITSFVPILFLKTKLHFKDSNIKTFSFFLENFLKFLKIESSRYIILALVFIAVLHEITEFFLPLLISYFNINILEVGSLVGVFFIVNFISNVITGEFENRYNNLMFYIASIGSFLILMTFLFLPASYINQFVILFGLFSAPLITSIICKGQRFVKHKMGQIEGGFMLEFIDDFSRILTYIVPLVLFIFHIVDGFKTVLLSLGAATVLILITVITIQKREA